MLNFFSHFLHFCNGDRRQECPQELSDLLKELRLREHPVRTRVITVNFGVEGLMHPQDICKQIVEKDKQADTYLETNHWLFAGKETNHHYWRVKHEKYAGATNQFSEKIVIPTQTLDYLELYYRTHNV